MEYPRNLKNMPENLRRMTACEKILQHLNEMEVFSSIPGRKHIAFGTFRANPARNLTTKKLKKWMNKQMKKLLL